MFFLGINIFVVSCDCLQKLVEFSSRRKIIGKDDLYKILVRNIGLLQFYRV